MYQLPIASYYTIVPMIVPICSNYSINPTCGFATYHEITRGKRTGFLDFSEPHAPDLRIFEISHSHKTNKSTEKYTIKLGISSFWLTCVVQPVPFCLLPSAHSLPCLSKTLAWQSSPKLQRFFLMHRNVNDTKIDWG